ncbi:MAG: D-2-hydroxyacid dehydrogenase, partial [Lachnospiraceae bacterium]|nr:D-2-hydroxyacid dehydrogenase [Lachnospiraceae bacterium]
YAKKVKALGAYTIGIRRTNKNKPEYLDEQYTLDEIDNLLPRADIVAMVLPGGEATHHLMDERRLRLMKKGSYLINVGRGNAIDPKALLTVMQEGHLGGCGLDVTEPEPLPADDPLWACGNVVITPHVAGNFFLQETFERIVRIAGTNMEAWANDGEFTTIVDFATGYKK